MKVKLADNENYLLIEQERILTLSSSEIVQYERTQADDSLKRKNSKIIEKDTIFTIKHYSNKRYLHVQYQKENSYIESIKIKLKDKKELPLVCSNLASNFKMNITEVTPNAITSVLYYIAAFLAFFVVGVALVFFGHIAKPIALIVSFKIMRKASVSTTTLRPLIEKKKVYNYRTKYRSVLNKLKENLIEDPYR